MVDAETGDAAVPDARPGVDVFEGLTKIGDLLNAGEGGLTLLQRTVDLTLRATEAAGAAFIEYGSTGGRVVAAAGALTWSLGLPIDLPDQAAIMMKAQARERVREFPT